MVYGGFVALAAPAAWADIHVGVSVALTGPGASLGVPVRNALSMWPMQIAGEKIVLHILDDAGDPTVATKNTRRMAQDNVDVIVGSANTPASIAVGQVANDARVVQLSPSPAELPEGRDAWTFRAVMPAGFYTEGILDHMKRSGVKTVGFLGLSDAYGESYLQALNKQAASAGLKVVSVERFTRADTSVAGQALKLVASRPDAIVVVAIGAGAALPQKALAERGYKGKIYHTSSSVSPDFLRLAGKDANGILVISGPEQVPEQLPASHPGRAVAAAFVKQYETQFGAGSRTQFAAHIYDFGLILQTIVPVALKQARPGTPAFRLALKNALESTGGVTVTKGVLNYTATDHWGHGPDARVMLTNQNGQWKLVR
ncbi:MAG: ABC transporter substrate-binding protein [Pseudoxanthomonas sp.]